MQSATKELKVIREYEYDARCYEEAEPRAKPDYADDAESYGAR
jgi:hypothetical protein